MKALTIKRLTLSNFKGIRAQEVEFSEGVTTISGKNGTGKTTIKDAFSWLLWGKDSEGNADTKFGIKTNDANGDFIPDLEHEVTGTFAIVDTETSEVQDVVLRRVLIEDWLTRQGETERELKGHHTDYFINGVPVATKREYDQRVSDLIPEAVFKMITDPETFLTMKWQAQREMLLTIAGEVRDGDIAGDNAAFAHLLAQLTGKTLDDYRKELGAKWKALTAEIDKIPTRIDEAQRAIALIIQPDYAALEAEKGRIETEVKAIDETNGNIAAANRRAYEAAAEVQKQIAGLKAKQQDLVYKAQAAEQQARFAAEMRLHKAQADRQAAREAIANAETAIAAKRQHLNGQAEYYTSEAQRIQADTAALRAKWIERNAETYQPGCLVCPKFGHRCQDPEAASKGEGEFYAKLTADLANITQQGKRQNQQAQAAQAAANKATAELQHAEDEFAFAVAGLQKKYEDAEQTYETIIGSGTDGQTAHIDPTTTAEYQQLQTEIDRLDSESRQAKNAITTATDTNANNNRKALLGQRLEEIARKLGFREVIACQRKRIGELNAQASKLAAERAEVEQTQATADEFVRRRMAEVERRVNALFPSLRFKMYTDQINGEQKPDCVASVDGVRYIDLNTAKKINAGLEAINVLCSFHGYTAPIFIDNAESVNTLIATDSQLIRLVVNTAEGLTVEKQ